MEQFAWLRPVFRGHDLNLLSLVLDHSTRLPLFLMFSKCSWSAPVANLHFIILKGQQIMSQLVTSLNLHCWNHGSHSLYVNKLINQSADVRLTSFISNRSWDNTIVMSTCRVIQYHAKLTMSGVDFHSSTSQTVQKQYTIKSWVHWNLLFVNEWNRSLFYWSFETIRVGMIGKFKGPVKAEQSLWPKQLVSVSGK